MATVLPPIIRNLRESVVLEPLRRDPRSVPGRPLGLNKDAARSAINYGQADFDAPAGSLSPEDRVLLYAYWNQKRHLEELTEVFAQLFSARQPKEPIMINLGCGPFTGGLALAGQLGPDDRLDYIGMDRSRAMRRLGEQFSEAMKDMKESPRITRYWAAALRDIDWRQPPGWRPVIVIASFLLASHSLNISILIDELNSLLRRIGRGETTVVYTNSPQAGPNYSFPEFRDALVDIGFRLMADAVGQVETERRSLALRYALFHRRKQRTLQLG